MALQLVESYTIVTTASDFPAAVGGVITLPNNSQWLITSAIDLGANRIVCQSASIIGANSNFHTLTTNNAGALITSTGNFTGVGIGWHNSGAGTIFNCNGTGLTGNSVFELREVQIAQGARMGTVSNYVAVVIKFSLFTGLLNGLTIDGTIGSTTVFSCAISSSTAGATLLNWPSTFTTTGRIRVMWCQLVTAASVTGQNLSTSATIGSESYIIQNNSYSTTGTPIAGVQADDLKAFFKNNRNTNNSATAGQYYMLNNVTATVIAATNTFVKVAGTTTVDTTERFTHTTNRFTYNGMQPQKFLVFSMGSITTNNGNEVSIRVAKNGTTIAASETIVTAQGAGIYVSFSNQVYTTLVNGDYIEVFTANTSATNNITFRSLNVALNAIP